MKTGKITSNSRTVSFAPLPPPPSPPSPKIWTLPTALFPHVCQVPEVFWWHNGLWPNQRQLGVIIQELEHLVHLGGLHLPERLFCFNHQTGQIQTEKSSWDYGENCWSKTALHPGFFHLQSQEMGSKHHCWPNKPLTQPLFPPLLPGGGYSKASHKNSFYPKAIPLNTQTFDSLSYISILSKNIQIYSVL